MELSDEQISRIWDAHTVPVFGKTGINPIVFARAIESEVRKQDTELIRQLVEALEKIDAAMPFPVAQHAIAAARVALREIEDALNTLKTIAASALQTSD